MDGPTSQSAPPPMRVRIPASRPAGGTETSDSQNRKRNPFAKLTPANLALVKLGKDLRAATTTAESREELIGLFLEIAINRSPLLCAHWLESTNGQAPKTIGSRISNPTLDNAQVNNQIVESSIQAVHTQHVQIAATEKLKGAAIVCVPFYIDDQTIAVLSGLVHNSEQNTSEGLLVCQMVGNHYDLWRARDEMTQLTFEVRSTATILELIGKAQDSRTLKGACYQIANELKEFFRCDYVAIGLKTENSRTCRLMAISSTAEFDNESRSTILFRSAFDEATTRENYTVFPPRTAQQRNAALGHKKLAAHLRSESAITVPLRNSDEAIIGAITVVGSRSIDRTPATRNLIHALEHPIGSSVELVRYAEGGWLRRATRFVVSGKRTNLMWASCAVTLIALIAMFVPVSYRIHCKCTAEPVVRRVCVAPYDGLLENTFVEPGDLVTKGQLLARMDAREIRFQRAGVEADKTRAIKTRDTHQAHREIPDALLADLERAKLEQEANLLEYREQNFEIKSNIDGVVLAGSIDRRENYPVTIGQSLFEVAPIDPLRVELSVPADEIMHVEEGQTVKFRFDGFGTQTVEGVISRIRPSTTIRDDENVFIAEAVLNNATGEVRPGMRGNARIYGAKHRLGWAIFHRPWEKIATFVGL